MIRLLLLVVAIVLVACGARDPVPAISSLTVPAPIQPLAEAPVGADRVATAQTDAEAARAEVALARAALAAAEARAASAEAEIRAAERERERQLAIAQSRVATWAAGIIFFGSALLLVASFLLGFGRRWAVIGMLAGVGLLIAARVWATAAAHAQLVAVLLLLAGAAVVVWKLIQAGRFGRSAAALADSHEALIHDAADALRSIPAGAGDAQVLLDLLATNKRKAAADQAKAGVQAIGARLRGKVKAATP